MGRRPAPLAGDEEAFRALVGPLFEEAPAFLARLARERPFRSWDHCFRRAREIAHAMPERDQVELLDAHPRLGAPPESVSELSYREQGYAREHGGERSAGCRHGADPELVRLNDAYEARFGFRYCVFVAGRPREALLPELQEALGADRESELHRGLDAVVDIGRDRQRRLGRPETATRLDGPQEVPGMYELGEHRYGKSGIRLVVVRRGPERHHLRDLTVDVSLEGDFAAAHVAGDNRHVIATDTMKNTVYALARDSLTASPEAFGLVAARHFAEFRQVSRATVTLREHPWSRIADLDFEAPDAFVRSGEATRLAVATATAGGPEGVESGIEDLTVLKTTRSAFVGFDRDRFTTLAEADDRLMATRLSATWGYGGSRGGDAGGAAEGRSVSLDELDFDASFERARTTLLRTFGEHFSPSVQASVWIIASAMLDADPALEWVRMVLPNLHHWQVDLEPFGMANDAEVFVSTTEPHGLIEATVRRQR
jgi:urate oxidase